MKHSLVLNLSTHRIWCYKCEVEVHELGHILTSRYVYTLVLKLYVNATVQVLSNWYVCFFALIHLSVLLCGINKMFLC